MSIVILAEKPSQAKAYADAFKKTIRKDGYIEVDDNRFFNGKKTYITWGFGHLVELVPPEKYKDDWKEWVLETLPIFPNEFKFQVGKGKKKQFNVVKQLLKNASEIIVATDSDREGENIARSIIKVAGVSHKPTKRLWINSLEVDEIQKGFLDLKDGKDYYSLYLEAQTRQYSDWLVGMNASRLYTLLLQKQGIQGVFSVGRVQSPTLYLIYKRDREIKDFESKPFYEIIGDVRLNNEVFKAKYKLKFDTKTEALQLLSEHNLVESEESQGSVKNVEKSLKKKRSPKLHSLSTLQTVANKRWKYSPSDVLKVVQELYEKKFLSYPRTDTNYITNNEFEYIKNKLNDYKNALGIDFDVVYPNARKRYVDGSKVQEHYAIVPTKQVANLNELSNKERNIYQEVLSTTLAMFAGDYEYEETNVEIDVNGLVLHSKGQVEKDKGWKVLYQDVSDNKVNKSEGSSKLPLMDENDPCSVFVGIKDGMTKPPKPFTEGGLIQVMKNAGKEVDDEDAREVLKETEGIGTEATRASIIETLKNQQYIEVNNNIVRLTPKGETLCKVLEGTLLASPEMTAKWEKYLRKIGQNKGSQQTFLDAIQRFILSLLEDAPKRMVGFQKQINNIREQSDVGNCPSCHEGVISDKGKFYGCSGYREGCKFTLPKSFLGKTLSKTNIQSLLNGEKTTLIKGFKGKRGKFDAYLRLNSDTKFEFIFPK